MISRPLPSSSVAGSRAIRLRPQPRESVMPDQVQKTNSSPPRCNVLGMSVSAINMTDAVHCRDGHIQRGQRGYVCVTGVHGVMVAQNDLAFQKILNTSLLTTPDGMPMVWVGRWQGHDIISGRVTDAPPWIKGAGLQWLHRLIQEPRRLMKRYAVNNSLFLCQIALQLTGIRRYGPQIAVCASSITSNGTESRSYQC